MIRMIKASNPGDDRLKLLKVILSACKEIINYSMFNAESRDLTAYIVLSLTAVQVSINRTSSAWEKRGYWVKADKFNKEWDWVGKYLILLEHAIENEEWVEMKNIASMIMERLVVIKAPVHIAKNQPWVGAWHHYLEIKNPRRR